MVIKEIIHVKGENYAEYISYLSSLVESNPEVLFKMQQAFAREKSLPCFCNSRTSWASDVVEPIGEYLLRTRGKDKAIELMSTELITGCPKSGRSWCD